uniref:Uncharacterized protein n=1 Tax=Rhizophora mucronata TaxID=61149 RepID=A0A2P2NHJ8_RHIMU
MLVCVLSKLGSSEEDDDSRLLLPS